MDSIQSVIDTSTQTASSSGTTTNTKELKDMFLKLLSVEMANQNPLSPMENSQWINQLAQFANIEQVQDGNDKLEAIENLLNFSQASNLVGKEVIYKNGDEELKGIVDSVSKKDNAIYLEIDGKEINIDSLVKVTKGDLQ